MYKKGILIAMAMIFFAAITSVASVVDAPHTDAHGVNCGSCHSYSLWWQYAPINQSLIPKNTLVNRICNNCHDGSKAQIPTQHTHSSTVFGISQHGFWESACADCHDPHYQGQLDWIDPNNHTHPAGLYLVEGTIGTITAGTVANSTDLGYSGVPDDKLNGDWTDRSRWGKKNANPNFDRGLILVVDTGKRENTYQVLSATNSVITIKGAMPPSDSGKSFGLIYGQLIRKVIATPESGNRLVTFFDPNILYGQGGFTDQETPRQGLCQVCHTKTYHWTEDALLEGHNSTAVCTDCHDPVQGFKPTLPGHDFLINTTPCTGCHQHLANNPLAVHGNTCRTCHSEPPLLRTDVGNFLSVTQVGLDPTGADLGNGNTATACTYCHTAYFGGHTHNHAPVVTANTDLTSVTVNCVGCHSASASPFVGAGEAHGVSGCATCHELTADGGLKGSAASATAPYGECITCHPGYFANHEHGASGGSKIHAVGLGPDTYINQSCSACHNNSGGELVTWEDILVVHQGSCGLCHNSGRTANVRAPYLSVADVIMQADAQHPVTCMDCHASHINQAPKFTATSLSRPTAIVGFDYPGQSIAGEATDLEGETIVYAKVSGPAWLTVATDGTLSGMPTIAGNDSFVVSATAIGGVGEATLSILVVNEPPAFIASPFSRPNATVGFAYVGYTIAGEATDPKGGAVSYSKVSGPAWLTVAPDGMLSGTPSTAGVDSFVVRATGTSGYSDATLNITVEGPMMAQLNPWANMYSNAPSLPAVIPSSFIAGNINVSRGSQRLLLVAVIMEHGAVETPSVSAIYNSTPLTQIACSSNQRESVWMGYLTDSQMVTEVAKPLEITYSGEVKGMDVKWASFVGVNQTTPLYSFTANSAAATTVSFGSDINYVANGMTVVVAGNGGSATGTLIATPAFTEGPAIKGSLQTSRPFTTARHTLSGTYPAATSVNWTVASTAWSALVVASLQP